MITIGILHEISRALRFEDRINDLQSDNDISLYKDDLDRLYDYYRQGIEMDIDRDEKLLRSGAYLYEHFHACINEIIDAMKPLSCVIEQINEHIRQDEDLEKIPEFLRPLMTSQRSDVVRDNNLKKVAEVRLAFCKKLLHFISSLQERIENYNEESVGNIAPQVSFAGLSPEVNCENIYHNLVRKAWIDGTTTSLGDFEYYFTGRGISPMNQIKWNESTTKLVIFLREILNDTRIWSKSAKIFQAYSKDVDSYIPVKKDVLKASYYNVLGQDNYGQLLDDVKKILGKRQ